MQRWILGPSDTQAAYLTLPWMAEDTSGDFADRRWSGRSGAVLYGGADAEPTNVMLRRPMTHGS
jgi:hypothetical protein